MEERKTIAPHRLTLEKRMSGTVTGVRDVSSFDEKEILLLTEEGKLLVKGEGLHVKQLDLEKGEVWLEGCVDSLQYISKNAGRADESFLKRMFR
ncbi:MAG: sporulation protein YabP [Clostridiales bacterium]|nr:sporulation protein YabP [Clostridiales bacterium]